MKVWIGHYVENPKEWFVVWANCVEDAWDVVDVVGSPETNSLREIVSPGLANFHLNDNNGLEAISLAKDKIRRETWLILGNSSLLQNPNEYISALYSQKTANQKLCMRIWRGTYLPNDQKNDIECFVVWAKDKENAIKIVDQSFGNVDKDSLIETRNEGFVDFHVAYKKGKQEYTPPKDDVKSGLWINLRGNM